VGIEEFIVDIRDRAIKASLDLIILHLLSNHAMSGYGINKALIRKFGLIIGPSTIYSKLKTLEKKGLINCEIRKSGKVYSITPEGQEIEIEKQAIMGNIHGYLITKLDSENNYTSEFQKLNWLHGYNH
jgi:DNA-binding PadR family transcriptional regulator